MRLAALHGLLRRFEYFPSFWNGALLVNDHWLSRLGLHGRATPVDFQAGRNGVDLNASARVTTASGRAGRAARLSRSAGRVNGARDRDRAARLSAAETPSMTPWQRGHSRWRR
jgi:hypothetical protein